jgi:hypothetical protein
MTNVEKYVRSHETGELVRVDQDQANAILDAEAKAAALDRLIEISQQVEDGEPLTLSDSWIGSPYMPIVDAILTAANTRRAAAATERDKSTPLTTRQGQLAYRIIEDGSSEYVILDDLYSDRSRDEYLADLKIVREYFERIKSRL